MAHIGVLDVLDSAHVRIDLIVGTSIGASIGGLYAAGYSPKQLEEFALSTNWTDVLDLGDESHRTDRLLNRKDLDKAVLSLRFTGFFKPVLPQALSTGQRLTMLLNSMVVNAPAGVPADFLRDLRIPFVAIATDIVSGERRLLTKGDLTEALRASATLPLRFNPLEQDSAILMDGGLLANIPVDVAKNDFHARLAIVSNATAALRPREQLSTPWDVIDQVISLMMAKQNATQLGLSDVTICPELPQVSSEDFGSIPEMIEQGRIAARKMLPEIFAKMKANSIDPESGRQSPSEHPDTVLANTLQVRVHGFVAEMSDSAELSLGHLVGHPFIRDTNNLNEKRKLLEFYRARGYALARVDSLVINTIQSRVDIYVDEGRIGKMVINGSEEGSSTRINPDLVLREVPFGEGDVFRSSLADRGLHYLTATGAFTFASLKVDFDTSWVGTRIVTRSDTAKWDPRSAGLQHGPSIQLNVQARAASVIRLGVLADNEFGSQFSLELANEDLWNTGVQYLLKGGLGPLARYANLTLDAPRLFRTFATFFVEGFTGYKDIPVYSSQTFTNDGRIISIQDDIVREARDFGGRLKLGGQVGRLGAVTLELRTERDRWFSVRDQQPVESKQTVTSLRVETVFDTRNDDAYPHRGTLIDGYFESGITLFGSELGYTKLFGQLEQAIPLSGLHTLIPQVEIGFGDYPTPRFDQFALGGIESFYGLNEYELRGKQMFKASLTYQIAIPHVLFFPTYVSMRYDVGATWPEPAAIKVDELVDGIGMQIGVRTPLGLALFGIGENFRFNQNVKKPIDFNSPRFYFSLGSKL